MPDRTRPATRVGLTALLLGAALAVAATPPAAAQDDPAMPSSGRTMDQVRSHFGEPSEERPAVGQPPITRWVYPGYTVYFEFDRVLTAVPHQLVPPAALGERPAIARR